MNTIALFDLATRRSEWLSVRSAAVAENVANANTPAYRAKDVEAFAKVLDSTGLDLAVTNPAHLSAERADFRNPGTLDGSPWEVSQSGNSVSLEQELLKANETNRDFALTTSIEKAFHRMLMTSTKA